MKTLNDFNFSYILTLLRKHQTLEAEALLEAIPAEYHYDEWLHAKAKCYINFEDYGRALRFLKMMPEPHSRDVQKSFLKCYEQLNDYTSASLIYSKFSPHEEKKSTLMKMINCFKKMNNYPYLHYLFQTIIELHPTNLDIRYAFCEFLIESNHPSFVHVLNDYILKWPRYIKFHLLNIEWGFKIKNHAALHYYILNIIHQNPFFIEANLKLLEFYIELHIPRQAMLFEQACRIRSCRIRFQQTLSIEYLFQQFNQQHPCVQDMHILVIPNSLKMLPEIIQKGFEMVVSEGAVCYLVGSTVHQLIIGHERGGYQDLDFTSNKPPPLGLFVQNRFCSSLYTARIEESSKKWVKVDCYVSRARTERFLYQDFLTRDFTINALYCDHLGQLFDPSGIGYDDLINKQLRTIAPPVVSLSEDPVRLVRALKLIHQGYTPTDELEFAINHWQPKDTSHYSHLIAVTKKTIAVIGIQAYVDLIKKYHLVTKLYGLSGFLDKEQLGYHLNRMLYSSHHSHLFRPATSAATNTYSLEI
jgi:tetratricopeptide (TPR) repeat protein